MFYIFQVSVKSIISIISYIYIRRYSNMMQHKYIFYNVYEKKDLFDVLENHRVNSLLRVHLENVRKLV